MCFYVLQYTFAMYFSLLVFILSFSCIIIQQLMQLMLSFNYANLN